MRTFIRNCYPRFQTPNRPGPNPTSAVRRPRSALTMAAGAIFLKSLHYISTISRLLGKLISELVQKDRLMFSWLADASFADLLAAARG